MNKSGRDCSTALYPGIAVCGCYYRDMRAGGFVLTGGNSIRMGRDKALLPIGDGHALDVVAQTLFHVTGSVMLVGQPQRYAHLSWPCLSDLRSGMGPLAGLETALANASSEWNLVVACDMPNLKEPWLTALLAHAERSPVPCVATRDPSGKIHPLCGAYHVKALPAVRRALDDGRLKLTALLEELSADLVETDSGLDNVNTPVEWEHWQQARSRASDAS